MRISKNELDSVAMRLRDLPANEKKHSKQDAVLLLSGEIAELKQRGYSLEQIAEALSVTGLPISTPTLKNYLQRAGRSAGKSRGSTAAKASRANRKHVVRVREAFAPTPDSDEIWRERAMDKQIYLIGGSKGGVGRSLVTMAVVDHLLEQGERVLLVESDTSNPDVWKAYKEAVDAHLLNLDGKPTDGSSSSISATVHQRAWRS